MTTEPEITQVVTTKYGTIETREALKILASRLSLNRELSQIVIGVYSNGVQTSLRGRDDGLYFMSGNLAVSL